jgi:heme-degrading monooxygenase HmoA
MVYTSIIPPIKSKRRPKTQLSYGSKLKDLIEFIGSNFSISTLLLIGASFQSLLLVVLPVRYIAIFALIPATVLLLRFADSYLIHKGLKANPYVQDAIPFRYTALVPNQEGVIEGPANENVAVLLLGAKSNHPFGFFAPGFRETGEWFIKMSKLLNKGEVKGFLGQTDWSRRDERGMTETNLISYWRSIDDLWAFAHGPLHREAWRWWDKEIKRLGAVGIYHEIYEAPKGHWETVYMNIQPTGLGATTSLRKGDELKEGVVSDEWISPIVDARKGKLAKSSGRFGRGTDTSFDATRPNAAILAEAK